MEALLSHTNASELQSEHGADCFRKLRKVSHCGDSSHHHGRFGAFHRSRRRQFGYNSTPGTFRKGSLTCMVKTPSSWEDSFFI